jgi:hypothetical protein
MGVRSSHPQPSIADWSSPVARLVHTQEVAFGSNPASATTSMPAIKRSVKIAYSCSDSLRPVQVVYVDDKHKEFVKFCNTLRCPLCGGQLDGNIHKDLARLYCVNDNNEYKVTWSSGKPEPEYELITYTYSQYQYVIEYKTGFLNQVSATIINRYNMDAHPIHRDKTKKEVFRYAGPKLSFFRARMEEDVFLKKLKTYQVFS